MIDMFLGRNKKSIYFLQKKQEIYLSSIMRFIYMFFFFVKIHLYVSFEQFSELYVPGHFQFRFQFQNRKQILILHNVFMHIGVANK